MVCSFGDCNGSDCYICHKAQEETRMRQERVAAEQAARGFARLPMDPSASAGLSDYAWMRARGD